MESNIQSLTDNKLTAIQQQRYDYLYPVYGELSDSIVRSLTGKGRGSWQSFLDKMDIVIRAKAKDREYYDALYEQFPLGELYSPKTILGDVGQVRRDLELNPYYEKMKVQSENDFFLVFVVKEEYQTITGDDGKEKKVLLGYRPLIKVKPE